MNCIEMHKFTHKTHFYLPSVRASKLYNIFSSVEKKKIMLVTKQFWLQMSSVVWRASIMFHQFTFFGVNSLFKYIAVMFCDRI